MREAHCLPWCLSLRDRFHYCIVLVPLYCKEAPMVQGLIGHALSEAMACHIPHFGDVHPVLHHALRHAVYDGWVGLSLRHEACGSEAERGQHQAACAASELSSCALLRRPAAMCQTCEHEDCQEPWVTLEAPFRMPPSVTARPRNCLAELKHAPAALHARQPLLPPRHQRVCASSSPLIDWPSPHTCSAHAGVFACARWWAEWNGQPIR